MWMWLLAVVLLVIVNGVTLMLMLDAQHQLRKLRAGLFPRRPFAQVNEFYDIWRKNQSE